MNDKKYAKCINNESYERLLTVGKVYEVIEEDRKLYTVIFNNCEQGECYSHRFEIVDNADVFEHITLTDKSMRDVLMDALSKCADEYYLNLQSANDNDNKQEVMKNASSLKSVIDLIQQL